MKCIWCDSSSEILCDCNMRDYKYYWRVKTKHPEYYKQPCKVLARGKMNSCLVEFIDGHKIITSRNYMRRRREDG